MTESEPAAAISTEEKKPALQTGEIIAPPDSWFRGKWLAISLLFVGGAGWFLYDGYVGYPKENEREKAANRAEPHNPTSIALQRIIGYGLLPAGGLMLFWALRSTRGQYRLTEDNTLHVPGHPPVPVDAIREIDQSKWDRKGIAFIVYELNGQTAKLKLDDFAYQRDPTDMIHDRLVAAIAPAETT